MALKCHKDSYARTLISKVISCLPAKIDSKDCYAVILEDTILFPEGGGQPCDFGKIDGVNVVRVERQGSNAVHYTTHCVTVDKQVIIEVDWDRRFDHMQQHSGQHLLTAITANMFGIKTISWKLAIGLDSKCYIELDTKKLTQHQIQSIENKCNECIRNRIAMTPSWVKPESKELEKVRSRGLPDDFVGLVRIVDIEGIDSNMCCGTHVNNLSDLQCIKLLRTESKRGSFFLYYVAGDRVLKYLSKCAEVDTGLMQLLSTSLDEHTVAVDRTLKAQKNSSKIIRRLMREVAKLISFKHLHSFPVQQLAVFHRYEGDNEFMNILASDLISHNITVFVTVGSEKGQGLFLLAGNDENTIANLGLRIIEVMDGKGGGHKRYFQGKVNKIENRLQAEQLVRDTFETAIHTL